MAVAALRNLVAKVRIPGAAALRASREAALAPVPAPAPAPRATLPSPPPQKAELENALQVKDKIESVEAMELFTSGNVIAEYCELTEQVTSEVSEQHSEVSQAIRNLALKYFCTGVGLGSLKHVMDSYYYNKSDFEFEECQVEVE